MTDAPKKRKIKEGKVTFTSPKGVTIELSPREAQALFDKAQRLINACKRCGDGLLTYNDLLHEEQWDAVLCVEDGISAQDCTYRPIVLTPAEIVKLFNHDVVSSYGKDTRVLKLMQNIQEEGLHHRPVITKKGRLVEGNHRLMAHVLMNKDCPCLEVEPFGALLFTLEYGLRR